MKKERRKEQRGKKQLFQNAKNLSTYLRKQNYFVLQGHLVASFIICIPGDNWYKLQ